MYTSSDSIVIDMLKMYRHCWEFFPAAFFDAVILQVIQKLDLGRAKIQFLTHLTQTERHLGFRFSPNAAPFA
jgi:hypothetical protein